MPKFNNKQLTDIRTTYVNTSNYYSGAIGGDSIFNLAKKQGLNIFEYIEKNITSGIKEYDRLKLLDSPKADKYLNNSIGMYFAINHLANKEKNVPNNISNILNNVQIEFNKLGISKAQTEYFDKNLTTVGNKFYNIGELGEDGQTKTESQLKEEAETKRKEEEKQRKINQEKLRREKEKLEHEAKINKAENDFKNTYVDTMSKFAQDAYSEEASEYTNIDYEITNAAIFNAYKIADNYIKDKKEVNEIQLNSNNQANVKKDIVKNTYKPGVAISIRSSTESYYKNKEESLSNAKIGVLMNRSGAKEKLNDIFSEKLGAYLASQQKVNSRGFIYKYFTHRQDYKNELATANSIKDDFKSSYGLTDNDLKKFTNNKKEFDKAGKDPKSTTNIIDNTNKIYISEKDGRITDLDEINKRNKELDISLNQKLISKEFYDDLGKKVSENIYEKTTKRIEKGDIAPQIEQSNITK